MQFDHCGHDRNCDVFALAGYHDRVDTLRRLATLMLLKDAPDLMGLGGASLFQRDELAVQKRPCGN